jgi:hypothetical protein
MLLAAAALIFVAAGSVVAYKLTRPASKVPTTYAAARRTPVAGKCLEQSVALTVLPDDRNTIELAAISYLIDVPAGTNVDVKIASYSKDVITGSDRYPSKYGSYNFTMNKQNGDWIITGFTRCG